MATPAEMAAEGRLTAYQAQLGPRHQPQRYAYLTPKCVAWMENELRPMPPDRGQDEPHIQLDVLLTQFVAGARWVLGDQFKAFDYKGLSTWAIRTTDVRLFGFFWRQGIFIGVNGAPKTKLSKASLYKPYLDEVIECYSTLGLNPPLCVTEGTVNAVL